ncbi:Nuclear control of ATPase protein 2 [Golovinomyces cichoracearum]|uniref:Nuclear control of ATPase protein 2 n=1 Tax=Golovinomyces cichoracearum TaxID=62708 RepID=A0A420IJ25_9PEZI|nr:Nuclear control of ATPase protein 2 [Golovinomyces cichoracearum]
MSISIDQVRLVDSHLDQIELLSSTVHEALFDQGSLISSSPRILALQAIIKELSTTFSNSVLSSTRILSLLELATLPQPITKENKQDLVILYENELYWLLVSKATVQVYGLLLEALLEQSIPLNDHIKYWDRVLGSYTYSSLFAIQTSPLRLWSWLKDIYNDAKKRLDRISESPLSISPVEIKIGFFAQWKHFYCLIKKSVQKRSFKYLQRGILSPIALCRTKARQNQLRLNKLREMGACALGILIVKGLKFKNGNADSDMSKKRDDLNDEWKIVTERSVALVDIVLRNFLPLETDISEFEDTVLVSCSDYPKISTAGEEALGEVHSVRLCRKLQHILRTLIPYHISFSQDLSRQYGRPSRITRFWFPTLAVLFSSTTVLQLVISRRKVITECIQHFGSTVRNFCVNWVLEPIKKVLRTIRHDPDSELALMSKKSLSGDRDSLERMVIDFSIDNSRSIRSESSLTESQISEIRARVREGDLTPILRVYERELKNPLRGTIRGDLVRTLLIQIQKTKVDVEIALNGIDALLRSQELVFGFVGLTPGIVICFGVFRYFGGVIRNMRGMKQGHKAGQLIRGLRNIDRILTLATPIKNNLLSNKDHGLLLCEVHMLRKHVHKFFPGDIGREFLEDINYLCNANRGLNAQLKALKRIRWGYSRWF